MQMNALADEGHTDMSTRLQADLPDTVLALEHWSRKQSHRLLIVDDYHYGGIVNIV